MHFKHHHSSAKKTAKAAPMRSTSLTKSHDIQYPGVHDVLCGRGGHAMAHPGNLKYRTLIDSCKPRYHQASTKFERSQLAANIVTMWRSQTPEGRFLTKTHPLEPDSVWHDIGNKDAIKKVSQTLRERRSYPMISGNTTTTGMILPQQQQQQETKPPQPIVDAIITSAQQQEQLEKIRLIEEEIKQLQQQNISQGLIEQQLRHQQMYHHPNQHQGMQQEPMAIVQNPGFDTGMNNMPIPEERKQQQERLATIQSDQPMKDVQIAPFDQVPQELAGRTRSRTSLTNKTPTMPSREALWDAAAESSGSFSLGSILDSERSNLTNSTTSTRQSSKSSFLHKLFGSHDDHNNSKTNHHQSPDRQTSGNSTVSTKTRTLMNESLHSISDNESSRSFKLTSSFGGGSSSTNSSGGLFGGSKTHSDDSSKTTPAGNPHHRGTAQSTTAMVTG